MTMHLAKELMNPNLLFVVDTMSLFEASKVLIENKISGAPVINNKKNLCGVVSFRDIVRRKRSNIDDENVLEGDSDRFFIDPSFYTSEVDIPDDGLCVNDVMTPTTIYVDGETPLIEIITLIVNTGVHRVFVQEKGCLAGVISTTDILKYALDKKLLGI